MNRKTKKIDMSSQPQPTRGGPPIASSPLIEVRNSPVHGRGVFAVAHIPKGTRILEYLGDRVSHAAADARYEDHDENDNHTFLFIVDKKTVIDAGVGGNDARFINHSCDPNCEAVIEKRRIYIDALRTIQPGEELAYDYAYERMSDHTEEDEKLYVCHCGAEGCRGTILAPPTPKRRRKPAKKAKKAAKRGTRAKRPARAKRAR